MRQIFSAFSVILFSSLAFAATNLQLDLSGANLGPEQFRQGQYEKFEAAMVQVLKAKCPQASGSYSTFLKDADYDLFVQWSDFAVVNASGTTVLDVSVTFDDNSYGLSLRQIDSVKALSCK